MNATRRDALRAARGRLAAVSESAALDAQLLLCHVLGMARADLAAHDDERLTEAQAAQFAALVARAESGEPLPYLLGRWAFYDRDLLVTPAVLIPRPETELLLEMALAFAGGRDAAAPLVAADVGTGSGALAVTFAAHVPGARVWALDVSAAALDVARANAALHSVTGRITFARGDLLAPLPDGARVDVLMANLPYIPSAAVDTLRVARHEPRLALDGGADGLALVRRLLADAPRVLSPGALVLLEIGAGQGTAALALARALGAVTLRHDYAGHDRIVRVQYAG